MAISRELNIFLPQYTCSYCKDEVEIRETSPSAKVKIVKWKNSCFHNLDCGMVKDLTGFFDNSTPDILRHDCDGIITFEEDGQKYMFLIEMKSTFCTSDLYKASLQIISSYIKVNVILNMMRSYTKDDYVVKGFIFTLPAKKSFLFDHHKQMMFKPKNRYKTEAEFCDELCCCQEKKMTLYQTECDALRDLPFSNNVLFNSIEFHHIEVSDNSIELDVHDFI